MAMLHKICFHRIFLTKTYFIKKINNKIKWKNIQIEKTPKNAMSAPPPKFNRSIKLSRP